MNFTRFRIMIIALLLLAVGSGAFAYFKYKKISNYLISQISGQAGEVQERFLLPPQGRGDKGSLRLPRAGFLKRQFLLRGKDRDTPGIFRADEEPGLFFQGGF